LCAKHGRSVARQDSALGKRVYRYQHPKDY
jgi:hypothetical protein